MMLPVTEIAVGTGVDSKVPPGGRDLDQEVVGVALEEENPPMTSVLPLILATSE